jgi:hypothetical protein
MTGVALKQKAANILEYESDNRSKNNIRPRFSTKFQLLKE